MAPQSPTVRHRSIRLGTYDYTQRGAYFVTICTVERECLFDDPWMKSVAQRAWISVTGSRPQPYEFVVMPNHVHGIIWLPGSRRPWAQHETNGGYGENQRLARAEVVPLKMGAAPLRTNGARGSLGAVVRAFKAATTRRINARRGTPGAAVWQHNYYEHVVRNDADLNRIRAYILDNPRKWAEDPENPANDPPALRRRTHLLRT
jgi:REP element-mobilizing transposase RayT